MGVISCMKHLITSLLICLVLFSIRISHGAEAKQTGQGPIADRTRERLATSDHGVVMYRMMVMREIAKVRQNLDPMNVIRDPDHPIIDTKLEESVRAEKAGSVTYHLPKSH